MYMYGHKEIGMLLTTNMGVIVVWKFSIKGTRKNVPKFPILEGKSSQWVPNHPERFALNWESPKFPKTSKLREQVS